MHQLRGTVDDRKPGAGSIRSFPALINVAHSRVHQLRGSFVSKEEEETNCYTIVKRYRNA